tara:strand:+ start:329 stop:517 length:189 start_codon:yes stop_codon:yes gene_type:complete
VKVGDLVFIKKGAVQADWHYGVGVILEIKHFPSEGGFISHKVMWSQDFSFHGAGELEVISHT